MELSESQLSRLVRAVELLTHATKVATEQGAQTPKHKMAASDLAGLMFIASHKTCRLNELAAHLRISATTASSIVDRLVKRELVDRIRPEADRRSIQLELTETGLALYHEVVAEQEAVCRAMLEALTPPEREPFITAMDKIARSFSNRQSEI